MEVGLESFFNKILRMYRLGGLLYNKTVMQFHGYSFCINLYEMKIDMEDPHLWTQIAITTDVKKN